MVDFLHLTHSPIEKTAVIIMKSATAMKIYPSAPIIVNSVSGSGYTG
jgi:hypothetical protein